jgi:Na+/melibiose symporter-like transporter
VWLAFTLFFVAVVLNAALAIHYFTWYAEIPNTTTIGRLQLMFWFGALCGVAIWVRLSRRLEKRTLCTASIVGTAVMMSLATVLVGRGRLLGVGDPMPLFVGNLIAGVVAAGVGVLPASMLADIADLDELNMARRRDGLFFGLVNFGEKIGAGVALLLAGVLLDLFVGLSPTGSQTPEAIARIGLLYGVGSAAILLTGVVALSGYDLDRAAVAAIQHRLRPDTTTASDLLEPDDGPVPEPSRWQLDRP